ERFLEVRTIDRRLQSLSCALDERAVERARYAQADCTPRTRVLCLLAALFDRARLARHDDLAWAVVVRRPDAGDTPAERLDHLVGETEDRRHRSRPLAGGGRHRQAAFPDESDGFGRCEGMGRSKRGELA